MRLVPSLSYSLSYSLSRFAAAAHIQQDAEGKELLVQKQPTLGDLLGARTTLPAPAAGGSPAAATAPVPAPAPAPASEGFSTADALTQAWHSITGYEADGEINASKVKKALEGADKAFLRRVLATDESFFFGESKELLLQQAKLLATAASPNAYALAGADKDGALAAADDATAKLDRLMRNPLHGQAHFAEVAKLMNQICVGGGALRFDSSAFANFENNQKPENEDKVSNTPCEAAMGLNVIARAISAGAEIVVPGGAPASSDALGLDSFAFAANQSNDGLVEPTGMDKNGITCPSSSPLVSYACWLVTRLVPSRSYSLSRLLHTCTDAESAPGAGRRWC